MENVQLNLILLKKFSLTTSECILFEYLSTRIDYVLNIDNILDELNPIFKKKDTIYRSYISLHKKGLIEIFNIPFLDAFTVLNFKNSEFGCLFCASNNNLQKHHYPIKKSNNGIDTITICKKCHFKFHSLSDFRHSYKIIES